MRLAYRATFERCGHWARNFMALTGKKLFRQELASCPFSLCRPFYCNASRKIYMHKWAKNTISFSLHIKQNDMYQRSSPVSTVWWRNTEENTMHIMLSFLDVGWVLPSLQNKGPRQRVLGVWALLPFPQWWRWWWVHIERSKKEEECS